MGENRFNELFCGIKKVTGIKDIGYHEIKDGRLVPKYKTETKKLTSDSWKDTHSNNTVFIEQDKLLKELISTRSQIAISDVEKDPRTPREFALFGIESVMLIPVEQKDFIKGIIVIASIGQKHQFTESEIKACKLLVDDFKKQTKGDF